MLLHRVFPYLPVARPGEPGHPLFVDGSRQGKGRWDKPDLYTVMYLSPAAEAAVGETFGNLRVWTTSMLETPVLPGSVRSLGTYHLDEETHPLLDLDDAGVLLARGLRPTDVVIRNRPRTRRLAEGIARERQWSGIRWWSYHRPQWAAVALWDLEELTVERVEAITGHPALVDAATTLAKPRRGV